MDKTSNTSIPLSPEETYEASKLIGRSLFSALQLAKENELRKALEEKARLGAPEDEKILRIPVPENIMPSQRPAEIAASPSRQALPDMLNHFKLASSTAKLSVIENPDGSLEQSFEKAESRGGIGKTLDRHKGALIGSTIGGAYLGVPGSVAGGALGSMLTGNDVGYGDIRYQKTIEHLDGSKEHVFDVPKEKGIEAHLKRNAGKYIGTSAGAVLRSLAKGSKLRSLLPVAGLFGGHAFDKYVKDTDLANKMITPEAQADMLTDLEFRRKLNAEKKAEDETGAIAKAFGNVSKHPVRMLLGGQQGFSDARKEFYYKRKAELQQELMEAQKEYIDTLSKIKTGASDETPYVDAFCNGIAHMTIFGKTASYQDVNIEDDAVKRFVHDMAGHIKSPFKPVIDTAATGLLNTAAGTAYLTYLLKKRMREEPNKYMEDHLPTRVELQPY